MARWTFVVSTEGFVMVRSWPISRHCTNSDGQTEENHRQANQDSW